MFTVCQEAVTEAPGYYFLSNDVVTLRDIPGAGQPVVFIGIANPHCLHVLGLIAERCDLQRIILVDNNIAQLRHFAGLSAVIRDSSDRIDYLQNLFKVGFGAQAVNILKSFRGVSFHNRTYIHGSLSRDPYGKIEEAIWKDLVFRKEEFLRAYHLQAEATARGLLIKSPVVGGFDTYYATCITASRKEYDHIPFNAGYGFGFLRDEAVFRRLRHALSRTPVTFIRDDITRVCRDLCYANRYAPIALWLSNVLAEYFVEKYPSLAGLSSFIKECCGNSPPVQLSETDIYPLCDQRERSVYSARRQRPLIRKKRSVHYLSFQKVYSLLRGPRCLEVVNMPRWIEQDSGVSKLPSTEYVLSEHFLKGHASGRYTTIFIHVLLGHGVSWDVFREILARARRLTDNLVILEHNSRSSDFRREKAGCRVEDVRGVLGAETFLDFCPGARSRDRNFIMVYRDNR
jgi:hypothetical protein